MQFYLYLNGTRRGPISADRVRELLAEGVLQPSDLGSSGEDGDWKPLGTLASSAPVEEPVVTAAEAAEPVAQPPSPAPEAPPPPPLPAPAIRRAAELPSLNRDALGPYSRSTLAPNETPFYKTSLHWIIFLRFGIIALLVFLFLGMPFAIAVQAFTGSELGWFALPLPVLFLVPPTLAFASSELVITDRRVLIKTGIVRRQTLEMFISKIESIAVDQGFFGRMLDYGSVVVRGTGGFEQAFEAIASPLEFRRWVQRLQSGDHLARA
jgi:hypothetical protein